MEHTNSLEQAQAWIKKALAEGWIYPRPEPAIYEYLPGSFVVLANADFEISDVDPSIHLGTFHTFKAAQEYVYREFRWHRIHADPKHKNKPAASIRKFRGKYWVAGAPRPVRRNRIVNSGSMLSQI